jgi:hypothetical protein
MVPLKEKSLEKFAWGTRNANLQDGQPALPDAKFWFLNRLSLSKQSASRTQGYEIDTRPVPWLDVLHTICTFFSSDSQLIRSRFLCTSGSPRLRFARRTWSSPMS